MVIEDPIKHLEFIQNVINRMSSNSFLLKGWTVTIVTALFALAAQNTNPDFAYLAFIPIITFWILDAYYLRQERLFRALYNDIRIDEENVIQSERPFTMDTKPFEKVVECWLRVMFSRTISFFYAAVIATVGIVIYVLIIKH